MKLLASLLFLTAASISWARPDYKPASLPGSGFAGQGPPTHPGPPQGLFPLLGGGPPPGFGGLGPNLLQPQLGGPKESPGSDGPYGGGAPPQAGGEGPYGGDRPFAGGGGDRPFAGGGGAGAPYGGGQCDCLRWTNYISADTPGDTGDFETLGPPDEKGRPGTVHHVRPDVCTIPVRMECRTVYDKVAWYLPYEKITHPCNPLGKGFACENKKQKNGKCRDYEVRLLCFYADKDYSCPCLSWTQWYDNDDPNDIGDEELIGRKLPRYVCAGGYQPVDVQCVTATGLDVFHAGNKKVQCDLQGLSCYNEDQGRNCKCHDYKVRFLCPKFPATYPMANYGAYDKNASYGGDYASGGGGRYNDSHRHGGSGGGGYDDSHRHSGGGYDDNHRQGSGGGGGGGYDNSHRHGGGSGGDYDNSNRLGGGGGGGRYDDNQRHGGGGHDQGDRFHGGGPFGNYPGDVEGFSGPGGYDGDSRGGGGGPGGYDGDSRGSGPGGYDGDNRVGSSGGYGGGGGGGGGPGSFGSGGDDKLAAFKLPFVGGHGGHGGDYSSGGHGGHGGDYSSGGHGGHGGDYSSGGHGGYGGDYSGGGPHNVSRFCGPGGPCNASHPGGPGYGNRSESQQGIAPIPFGIDERIKSSIRGGFSGHNNGSYGGIGGHGGHGDRGGHEGYGGIGKKSGKRDETMDDTFTNYEEEKLMVIEGDDANGDYREDKMEN